jgi:SOS-response transcriptional repressor LexA
VRKLSQRQEKILAFINEYVDEHGYPPSIRDQLDLGGRLQPANPRA